MGFLDRHLQKYYTIQHEIKFELFRSLKEYTRDAYRS